MRHAGNRLRAAARPIEAEQVNAILPQLDQFAAACGADRRRLDIRFRRFAFAIPNDAHDFRDNVVGAAHPDLAPDAHALAADVVVVVERRALHRHAANIHRGQVRQRRELARAPDLPRDFQQLGDGFLRGELKSNRPSREFVRRAQHLARAHVRNLDRRAVDQEIQRLPFLLDFMHGLQRFLDGLRRTNERADVEAVFLHKRQHILLGFKALALDITDLIKKCVQMAARRHLRIEVAQRTRSRIARVFERLGGGFIVFFEFGQAHNALALHLHPAGERDGQRNGADRHRLRQNRLADLAVSARRRLNQLPSVVCQVDRQAVELIFHAIAVFRQAARVVRLLFAALRPRENLLFALRLVHTPEPRDVTVLLKALHHRAANAPGRRIRHALAGLFLQPAQLGVHRIPFVVGYIGFILIVIPARGLVQLVDQLAHALQIVCLAHVLFTPPA